VAEARCSVVHVDLLGHIDALAGKRINSEQRLPKRIISYIFPRFDQSDPPAEMRGNESDQQILQQGSFIGGLEVKAFCQQRSLLSLRRVGVGEHARINDQTLLWGEPKSERGQGRASPSLITTHHLLCRKDAVHDWDVLSWSVGRGFDQQNAWGEVSAFLARPVGICIRNAVRQRERGSHPQLMCSEARTAQCKAEREGWKEHG